MEDICTACLCTGRKMQFLYNTEYFNVFSQILNEALIYNPNMYLMKICWECRAVLRKVELFKQKVKLSHAELVNYQLQNDPKMLTNHTSLKCESIFNIGCYEDDIKVENSSVFNITEDSIIDLPVAVDIKTEEHSEPESFVKDLCVTPEKKKDTKKKIDKPIKEKSKKKLNGNKKNKKKSVKIRKKLKSTKNIVSKEIIDTDDIIEDDFDRTSDNYCDEEIKIEENVLENNEKNISDNKVTEVVKKVILKEDNHLEPRLPEKPVCVECGKSFSSKKTYRYHLNVLHKGQNRYPCPRCGKVYQWKSNLGRHMRSHKAMDSGELYCAMCDKRFASVATYRQHLRVSRRHVTESEFSFMCNECGKKFVNKTRLRDHIDWEHLKKIKFRCQLCNKPFKCHTSLYVHLQNVHRNKELKNNLCHVCGKSYQNAAKLKYHITAMHTSETPYQCVQCQASFGWYSSLYRHIKEVHHKVKMYQKPKKKCKKITLIAPQLPVLHEQGP